MDTNVDNNQTQKTYLNTYNKVYCLKCKTFVTREEREHICDFECLQDKRCNKKTSQLVPSYKKCYTVYQYDREKYGRIYRKLQKVSIKLNDASIFHRVSPYRVLDLCYIRGEDGKPKNLWFEDKAHRRIALERIMQEIARVILLKYNNDPTEQDLRNIYLSSGVAIFIRKEYIQAEIHDLREYSIKDKIHYHFLLFRYLKTGCSVEDSMRYVNIALNRHENFKKEDYNEVVKELLFIDKPSDEVGTPTPPKIYITLNQLRGDLRLLDFFREMTEKFTLFYKKDIRADFCKLFQCSETFFDNRFNEILEEVSEQASWVGLKVFCYSRLLYLGFEPYDDKDLKMYVSDKRGGLM